VKWLIDDRKMAPEDIAVMFRTNYNNAWSTPIADQLGSHGIPVVSNGEVAEILEEPTNRQLIAVARIIFNPRDFLAWWTLLRLTPGIGSTVRDHLYRRAEEASRTFAEQLLSDHADGYPDLQTTQQSRVADVVGPILALAQSVNLDGVDLGEDGWGTWLAAEAPSLGGCDQYLRDLLIDVDAVVDPTEGLGRFLGQLQPVGNDLRSGRAAGAVRLMTMASSKGLTVRAAIVCGVEESVVPLAGRDLAEERRLLYVAMTRSTDYLYLTWSGTRTGPTARTGAPKVGKGRNRSPLLTHGPVNSESGDTYLSGIGA
jgi:superfamily I DNA/RNA helicase